MPLDDKKLVRVEACLDQWESMLREMLDTLVVLSPKHARRLLILIGEQANSESMHDRFKALCDSLSDLTGKQRDAFVHLILVAAHCGVSRLMLNGAKQFAEARSENPLPGTMNGGSDDAV